MMIQVLSLLVVILGLSVDAQEPSPSSCCYPDVLEYRTYLIQYRKSPKTPQHVTKHNFHLHHAFLNVPAQLLAYKKFAPKERVVYDYKLGKKCTIANGKCGCIKLVGSILSKKCPTNGMTFTGTAQINAPMKTHVNVEVFNSLEGPFQKTFVASRQGRYCLPVYSAIAILHKKPEADLFIEYFGDVKVGEVTMKPFEIPSDCTELKGVSTIIEGPPSVVLASRFIYILYYGPM